MSTNTELRALAEVATPITTDLFGDRYFFGPYSCCELTKEQDAFIAAANPAAILELLDRLASVEAELAALKAQPVKAWADCWGEPHRSMEDAMATPDATPTPLYALPKE